MVGNMYGVDVKITPTPNGLAARPIELNGVNSGTDFFKMKEGLSYYQRFARKVASVTDGKPIFFHASPSEAIDPLARVAWETKYKTRTEEEQKHLDRVRSTRPDHFAFDSDWLDDKCAFEIANMGREPEHEEWHYAFGANSAGVPAYLYTSVKFSPNLLTFTLYNGATMRIRPDEIGGIRSLSDMKKVPAHFKHLFFNVGCNDLHTPLLEQVTDYKNIMYWLETIIPDSREQFVLGERARWPETIFYGLSGTSPEHMLQFIETTDAAYYVRKYNRSYCGVGVSIHSRDELVAKFQGKRDIEGIVNKQEVLKNKALLRMMLNEVAKGIPWDEYLTLYQPFIESVPLPHPATGELHDGCARIIVLSLDGKHPEALDGQWRLAPAPMNAESTLDERLRANLSRGATAAPMSEEHYELASKCARDVVMRHEAMVIKASKMLERVRGEWRFPHDDINLLQHVFWAYYLDEFASRIGENYVDEEAREQVRESMHHK